MNRFAVNDGTGVPQEKPRPSTRSVRKARRIDAHHHLWRYTPEEYQWIDASMSALRRDFLLNQLRVVLDTAGVDATIVVQARQTVEETQWLLSLASEDSPIGGVVGWLPVAAPDFALQYQHLLATPSLRGLRHVVQDEPAGFLDGEAFNRGIRKLAGLDLVYDLLIRPHQMEECIRFVDRHPEQPFVLDHLGKPEIRMERMEPWQASFREMARRPHVACKLSGLITEADPHAWTTGQLLPYLDVALQAFGPDRLMIGSDWPVLTLGYTYEQWWRMVEDWTSALSEAEQGQILGETAARVYGLHSSQARKESIG